MNEESPPLDPEITSISIAGFKSIERIGHLPLRPINVLIGANGSGKSNFIDAFSLLQAVRENTLDAYVERSGGADRILHFGSKITKKLMVTVAFHGGGSFELTLEVAEDDRLMVTTGGALGSIVIGRPGHTGLLDFSWNPLVGLWFACEETEVDGKLFAYRKWRRVG